MNTQSRLRLNRNEQIFFLNSSRVGGLQSCSFENNYPYEDARFLGMFALDYLYNGNRVGNISLTKFVADKEFIWNMTGSGFNGILLTSNNKLTNNVGFTSGYLTNYSFRSTLGEIPEVTAQITAFGDCGGLTGAESPELIRDIYLAGQTPTGNPNYISLGPVQVTSVSSIFDSLSGYNSFNILKLNDTIAVKTPTNLITGVVTGASNNQFYSTGTLPLATEIGYAYKVEDFKTIGPGSFQINVNSVSGSPIQSCEFNVNFPLIPVYILGNTYPNTILFNKAPKVDITLEILATNYNMTKLSNYPNSGLVSQNITIDLVDYNPPYSIIQSYTFNNMNLVSERYSQANSTNSTIILNYSSYIL